MSHTDASASPASEFSEFSFADMRLRVGERVQIEAPKRIGAGRHIVKLIGYVEGESMLTTLPQSGGGQPPLIEGDAVTMRIFSGQRAFGFGCHVDKIIRVPFDYMHLSFPKKVTGKIIRQAPRIRVGLKAGINKGAAEGRISNLSANGAEIQTAAPLGKPGDALDLAFGLDMHGSQTQLSFKAVLRTVRGDTQNGEAVTCSGVEFQDVNATDRMVLHSLIYQEMVERPQNLA